MKFLFLLIFPICSLKCSNCKHFIEPKSNILLFGKCNLFPKTKDIYSVNNKNYLDPAIKILRKGIDANK